MDFKEWIFKSLKDSIDEVIEMAVCMSNGGGGTVVLGVKRGVGVWSTPFTRLINKPQGQALLFCLARRGKYRHIKGNKG